MKKYIQLIAFLVSSQIFAQVFNGDLTLSTQSEINNFSYTEVTGQLTISEATSGEIISLNGLNTLTTIGGGISINGNSNISTLNGLDNLSSVGASNPDPFGFDNVSLYIVNNNNLTSILALQNLTSIGNNITIRDNSLLSSLNGLESITSVSGNVFISNNDSLTSLSGLNNITVINGIGFLGQGITIFGNNSLTSLIGLNSLTSIDGKLFISNNDTLTSLTGLESLTSITSGGGSLSIDNNDSLVNLVGLNNINNIDANVNITNNDLLTNLEGFENIENINGDLTIRSNISLITLQGLDNLISIGGSLFIDNTINVEYGIVYQGNTSLNSLSNLSELTSIGEKGGGMLKITGCSSLNSLEGLENLNTVQQLAFFSDETQLQIGINSTVPFYAFSPASNYNNPLLTDFCGINRLVSLGEITSSNNIIDNNGDNPTLAEIESLNCQPSSPPSQTVFKWRTATDNGTSITETINGITVTFTGANPIILDVSGFSDGGFNGGGFDNVLQANSGTNTTFSFSEPVNVISIMSSTANLTFTPNGGNNNVIYPLNESSDYGVNVLLNWENVTSFTVNNMFNSGFTFDNLRVAKSSSLSTKDFELNNIKIYPNPITDYINIKTQQDITKAALYNLQGQKINVTISNNRIDIRNASNGIYFLKLKTKTGSKTFKIIKK